MDKIDPDRLSRAVNVLDRGLREGAAPGGVVCAMRGGEIVLHEAFGTLDREQPTGLTTRYDLASLTKPMATGATILSLVEDGILSLQTQVSDIDPKLEPLAGVTVGHLLTHTSGLPAWAPLYENGTGKDAALGGILALPRVEPGSRYAYSCLGFILLARLIETVTGQTLDRAVHERVLQPLHLERTGYLPAPDADSPIAPTVSEEGPNHDAVLTGMVHDGNARGIGGVSGNAGLFGTAEDVATFGEAVRVGRYFSAPTRARILTTQTDPAVGSHSLLFFARGNPLCPVGDLLSPRAVGHSGFTGTALVIDPEYDLTVAVLTNAVFHGGKSRWLRLRRHFMNSLAASLTG